MKNQTKTFKVVMLPYNSEKAIENTISLDISNKARILTRATHGNKIFDAGIQESCYMNSIFPQHLYIISDETPKEGDKVIHKDSVLTVRENKGLYLAVEELSHIDVRTDMCKKIVVTTDDDLIRGGRCETAQFKDSFIKVYIKAYNDGKPITEVDLEMECGQCKEWGYINSCRNNCNGKFIQIKTRPDNTVIIHESKKYSREEVKQLFIKKLESLMPKDRNKFGDKFTGTDICDAIEFGTESQLYREKLILERAINEIDLFLDENC